jgi:transposase
MAYSSSQLREYLLQHRVQPIIPTKSNQTRERYFRKAAYRERNIVERFFGRIKHFRRLATRYEKLATSYLTMLLIATTVTMWL